MKAYNLQVHEKYTETLDNIVLWFVSGLHAAAVKDAVCLFRHPSVVYALPNLHRGPKGCEGRGAGPHGLGTATTRGWPQPHARAHVLPRPLLVPPQRHSLRLSALISRYHIE